MVDEKYINAKSVYLNKNYDEAYSLFNEIVLLDPNNYMSIIYKGFCLVWKTTLTEPHHVDMVSAIKNGFDVLRKLPEKPNNYVSECIEIINELNKFVMFSAKLFLDKFNYEYNEYVKNKKKTNEYKDYSGAQGNTSFVEENLKKIEEKYVKEQKDYITGISLTAAAYNTSMEIILYDVMNGTEEVYSLDNYITLLSISKSIYARFRDIKVPKQVLDRTEAIYNFCNKKVDYYQNNKKEEYWSNHSEEKTDIENKIKQDKESINQKEEEIINLTESKKKLTLDLSESPSYLHQQEHIRKLADVNNTLLSLGAFDIKKRKQLLDEKEKLEGIIKGFGQNIKNEKEAVENKFKADKKAIDDKINQLQNDIINLKRDISANERLLNQNR